MTQKKIAVLLPCYNEEQTIEKVIRDFQRELPEATVYVYNNNSTDRTAEIASSIEGVVVKNEYRQGKGNVIRSMFRQIDADCYIMADGDDTYPAEHAREMTRLVLEEDMDMVIGDRLSSTYFVENKRAFHNFGNKLVRWLINKLFSGNVKDIMTGYRAFSYDFVKLMPIESNGFEVETEMTINALDKKFNICEIPVQYRDRPEGSVSKLNTVKDGIRVIRTIFRMFKNYRPMLFFGLVSAVLFLLGAGFFTSVFVEYLQTGLVLRLPTLIVSTVALLASITFFSVGLILDIIIRKHRQNALVQINCMSKK
ncbi:MAG: glycosyltransferase [Ruminococcaceae bacterium]|nr:glycosyltransferase [Oscillospiraceae bacterium]